MKLRQITQMLLGLSIATANASATDAMHRNADVSNTIDVTGVQKYMVYPHLQKGFEALEKGLADRAIKEFQQANSLAPNSVSVALYLAEAHRRFGQLNKAEAVLSLMMMKFSENKALASAIKNIRTELAAKSNLENLTPTSQQKTTLPNDQKRQEYLAQNINEIPQPRIEKQLLQTKKIAPLKNIAHIQKKAPTSEAKTSVIEEITTAKQAYLLADEAYKGSAQGHIKSALVLAKQAVDLEPDNASYKNLFLYLLLQNEDYQEAEKTAQQMLSEREAADDEKLESQLKTIRKHLAFIHFEDANKSYANGDVEAAIRSSKQGITYAPNSVTYRLQLLHILIGSANLQEARNMASVAIQDQPLEPALRVIRGYIHQRLALTELAKLDFDSSLAGSSNSKLNDVNFRVIAASAALEVGEPHRAISILQAVQNVDDQAVVGLSKIAGTLTKRAITPVQVEKQELTGPNIVCTGSAWTPSCEVWPGQTDKTSERYITQNSAREAAQASYSAGQDKAYTNAISFAEEAYKLEPQNPSHRLLLVNSYASADQFELLEKTATRLLLQHGDDAEILAVRSGGRYKLNKLELAKEDADLALQKNQLSLSSEILLLVQQNRKSEARDRFLDAQQQGDLNEQDKTTMAYLALLVGESEIAYRYFQNAEMQGSLPISAFQDVAYTAAKLGDDKAAITNFKRAINAREAGTLVMPKQALFDTRREIANRDRVWGISASINQRSKSHAIASYLPTIASHDGVNANGEIFWRPLEHKPHLLEVYGGMSMTISSQAGYATGQESLQGQAGLRVKPISDINLKLSIERNIGLGGKTQSDWLQRVSYSDDWGTDLETVKPSWSTGSVFAEVARYSKQTQTFASFEAQVGRSYRWEAISSHLVITPHGVLAAQYDNKISGEAKNAVGIGAGVNLRYWYNEDKYNAPRSHNDLSLQYRTRLTGGERAKGVFMRLTFTY